MMKKLIFACLCAAVAAAPVMAQKSVVKEAKSSFKLGEDFNTFVQAISPAFTNPETAEDVETWYIAGENGFKNYDYYLNLYRLGQPIDEANMGHSLLKGYEYFMKALPLDSLPDEKGKVKPKYSSKMLKNIASHYEDFNIAAAQLWGAKDYPGAYEAWGVFLDLPGNPALGKSAPTMPADTIISTVHFNRALAAWQSNQLENALSSFNKAIEMNYDDPQIYEYAAEIARQLKDYDSQYKYAQTGYERTGDAKYLMVIINHYIDKEDYDKARELLDTAINTASNPKEQAYLYVLKGIIAERTDPQAAIGKNGVEQNYKKAMELDKQYGGAFYNYGRILLVQANQLDEEAGNMTQSEYNQYKKNTLIPLMKEAAEYMEEGYQLDNSLTPALQLLQQIYYMLGDEQNLERVKNM